MSNFITDNINTIINGDCLDVMKQLPDKCIDLVLTDPPYGIGISSNPVRQMHDKKDWDDNIPIDEYFKEIFRVSKEQIIWGGNYFNLPTSQGFLVWDKIQPYDFSLAMCEQAWCSYQKPAKLFRYSVLKEKGKEHPTQKPVKLFEWCLKYAQKELTEDSIILDCFSGSGTTAIACHNLNRNFICIEKDKDYYNASVERLNNAKAQLKLF